MHFTIYLSKYEFDEAGRWRLASLNKLSHLLKSCFWMFWCQVGFKKMSNSLEWYVAVVHTQLRAAFTLQLNGPTKRVVQMNASICNGCRPLVVIKLRRAFQKARKKGFFFVRALFNRLKRTNCAALF
jgi:hypothetical protein